MYDMNEGPHKYTSTNTCVCVLSEFKGFIHSRSLCHYPEQDSDWDGELLNSLIPVTLHSIFTILLIHDLEHIPGLLKTLQGPLAPLKAPGTMSKSPRTSSRTFGPSSRTSGTPIRTHISSSRTAWKTLTHISVRELISTNSGWLRTVKPD